MSIEDFADWLSNWYRSGVSRISIVLYQEVEDIINFVVIGIMVLLCLFLGYWAVVFTPLILFLTPQIREKFYDIGMTVHSTITRSPKLLTLKQEMEDDDLSGDREEDL